MLHYLLHASEVPWQDQLLYAGIFIAAIALVFFSPVVAQTGGAPPEG